MPICSDLPKKTQWRRRPTELRWPLSAPLSEAREFGQSAVSMRVAKLVPVSIWIRKEQQPQRLCSNRL